MRVNRARICDENDDSGDDQSYKFVRILEAIHEDASRMFVHKVKGDEAPNETDDDNGAESHEQPAAADTTYDDHSTSRKNVLVIEGIRWPTEGLESPKSPNRVPAW